MACKGGNKDRSLQGYENVGVALLAGDSPGLVACRYEGP